MNAKLKKFMVAIGGTAVIGGSLIAVQGTSSAAAVTEFRLSNFSAVTASSLCVKTDLDTVCVNDWNTGKSEIFNVEFENPDTFRCSVAPLFGNNSETANLFSRNEYKECKINGTITNVTIRGVRPDGTESNFPLKPI